MPFLLPTHKLVIPLPLTRLINAAKHLLTLVQPQQAGSGKFIIHQDHATIQGQNIGDHQQITQHFGKMPEA